jgi:hypothetical protein
MKSEIFRIVLVGGSGFWSEVNHIPNFLSLKRKRKLLSIVGICDIKDPYETNETERPNLHALLRSDKPEWIKASNDQDINTVSLDSLHKIKSIDLMVIACNPTMHFQYSMWALKNGISVICDKPLIDVVNAASDPRASSRILTEYDQLLTQYKKAKEIKPHLTFSLMLRRRTLPAFNVVADRLQTVADNYGAGINHINILNHNGIYKYPEEMEGDGAHDFSAGVGALSHSSYHYIDLFNRYLTSAPGEIAYIRPKLTHIFRISDYLAAQSYEKIRLINHHKPVTRTVLPVEVLACELDFAFQISFYNSADQLIGDGNFISNHVSFSPRTRDRIDGVTEPAQFEDGGRTSHLYIDIHQSGLQNLEILKNDVAFQRPHIIFQSRTHPAVRGLANYEVLHFDDAYNRTEYHLRDMLESVIDSITRRETRKNPLVVDIKEDAQNLKLFAKFYELIAHNYQDINITPESQKDDMIFI